MAKSDVAVKVASTTALALVSSLEQDAGAGLEHMDKEDFALPFLRLLASNSPEVSDVEGARPGMFYNSVTGQLDRKSTRLNSSHVSESRMPSSA